MAPKKKKLDVAATESRQKMIDKFNPESGLKFTKRTSVNMNSLVEVCYDVKGNEKILNYLKLQFFNAICMLDNSNVFEYVRFPEQNENIIIARNTNQFGFATSDINLVLPVYPIISIDLMMDNVLTIAVKINVKNLDPHVLFLIENVEYLLNVFKENYKILHKRCTLTYDMIICEELVSKDVINDNFDELFNFDYFLNKKDKEAMKKMAKEQEKQLLCEKCEK